MVIRVHDGTANRGTDAHVTLAARFADLHVLEVQIADLTDRCLGVHRDQTNFAAGKTNLCVLAFLRHELRRVARRADQLRALAGLELDAVDHRADRDVLELQRVADLDVRVLAGNDGLADVQAVRSDDVALLAVCIVQQSDVRGTVRIVFDRFDGRGNAVLVALEVDDAVLALCAAALVANRDLTGEVAAGFAFQIADQRLFRSGFGDLLIGGDGHMSRTRSGGVQFTNSHLLPPYCAMPSNSSMPFESAVSLTYAFFLEAVLPS